MDRAVGRVFPLRTGLTLNINGGRLSTPQRGPASGTLPGVFH